MKEKSNYLVYYFDEGGLVKYKDVVSTKDEVKSLIPNTIWIVKMT